MNKKNMLYRTKLFDRLCHATVVICFMLVAFSGLGMFFPSMRIFSYTLGTPQLGRLLHPILGCVVFIVLMIMLARFAKYNLLNKNDRIWFKNIKNVTLNQEEGKDGEPLPVGKYNAGQKVLFWAIMGLIMLLLVSGLISWNRYFAGVFPIPVLRAALLIHSLSALALMLLIMGHIYMALWVKGTIKSMIGGYVPKKWAKKHHPLWYKEMVEKEQKNAENKP